MPHIALALLGPAFAGAAAGGERDATGRLNADHEIINGREYVYLHRYGKVSYFNERGSRPSRKAPPVKVTGAPSCNFLVALPKDAVRR